MLSRAESDKKKAHADISMPLGKNGHEHEYLEYLSVAKIDIGLYSRWRYLNQRWSPQKKTLQIRK